MRYLVVAVFSEDSGARTLTHDFDCGFKSPYDMAEEIVGDCIGSPEDKYNLQEVFVYASAQNSGSAPVTVAHWDQGDGLFGEDCDE